MAAPDPEGMSLLSKVIAAGTAVIVPIWGARTWLEKRFETKADKGDVEKSLKHIEKLYENAEEDRKLTRDLHDKAMERIQINQTQLIDILARK